MGIEFVLQQPCATRRRMPEARLRALVVQRGIAEGATDKFREQYPHADDETLASKCTVEVALDGPDGTPKPAQISLGRLLDMLEPLKGLDDDCGGCPANVSGRGLGCIGRINAPIAAGAERWLLARLPDDAKDAGLQRLARYLAERGLDGAAVDAQRGRSRLFELKAPVVRKWGGWLGPKLQINSSQLLQMLALGGPMSAERARLYARLLDLSGVKPEATAPGGAGQFGTLLRAVNLAARLGTPLDIKA